MTWEGHNTGAVVATETFWRSLEGELTSGTESVILFVQDNRKQGFVDLDLAIILDET